MNKQPWHLEIFLIDSGSCEKHHMEANSFHRVNSVGIRWTKEDQFTKENKVHFHKTHKEDGRIALSAMNLFSCMQWS